MADDQESLAALLAERDALRQQVFSLEYQVRWRHRLRRWGAAFLVVLTCVSFAAATTGLWARRNFLNTEVFVERLAPLVEEVGMQEALTRVLGEEAVQAVDPRRLVSEALPERGQILVAPIGAAVETFIRNLVGRFVTSEQFDRLWAATVERSHRAAVALLEGKQSQFASTAGGEVTLNLVPIINAVLAEIGKLSPEILGRNITLPTLTVNDAPEAAVQRLESALGVNLEDGYGELVVFQSDELAAVQDVVTLFDRGTVLLVLLTLLLLPLTLWVSPRPRRTVLQLCVGIAIGLVLVRRTSFYVEGHVLDLLKDPANEPAVQLVLDTFLDPLRVATLWLLGGLAVAVVLAMLSGPYPWAVQLRAAVALAACRMASLAGRGARGVTDPRTVAWLQAYKDKVRLVEAAAFVFALLFLSLPWLVIFLLAAVIVGVELLLARATPEDLDDVPAAVSPLPPSPPLPPHQP